ncbi:hypothetical protein [Haladaptatus sp. DJG-WS-42]|uniref:hypothetical protein n=1 Tax=Haladaptatus sp. DJG-WS-42 TaxID=3120516 RepID=UPI0030D081A5
MTVELTMATGESDRIRPIHTGAVTPKGIDLSPVTRPLPVLFRETVKSATYDIVEMSFATYIIWATRGDCPYVGLPVFPSRMFRHSAIYVNEDAAIGDPAALVGKTVGIPAEYQTTAAVVVRGLLAHEYDVHPKDIDWVTAREERLPISLPPGVEKRVAPEGADFAAMVARGDLDALVSPLTPETLGRGVERLFPNFKAVEAAYYRRTGLFPIMHALLLRREVYEENPWIATSVYTAMEEAKALAIERLDTSAALPVTLPWLIDHLQETRAILGENFWPYGFVPNRADIEMMCQYMDEQGLTPRKVAPADLFVDELRETGDRPPASG